MVAIQQAIRPAVLYKTPKSSRPPTAKAKEWTLQAAAVTALRRARKMGWPIRIAGDMNAAKRSLGEIGRAKATGLNPGEPDLRVYMAPARLVQIEFKRTGEFTSGDQDDAHAELRAMGFDVTVLTPANDDEAAAMTLALIADRLGLPIPAWKPPARANRA
jgi:hypothetical protein